MQIEINPESKINNTKKQKDLHVNHTEILIELSL